MYTHHVLLAGQPRHARRRQVRHQRALRCQPLGRFQGTQHSSDVAILIVHALSMMCDHECPAAASKVVPSFRGMLSVLSSLPVLM